MPHRIALIHAVTVAVPPIAEAFRELWPEARPVNILDDSLSPDREKSEILSPEMYSRFETLTRYAVDIGSTGILFTCSAFGEAIEAAATKVRVPVLKPNEAMFDAALARGSRIGMLATFGPSVTSMEREFEALARERGSSATIETHCVPEAMTALRHGDGATHDRLLANAAPKLGGCDVVLLAHFSTARAQKLVTEALSCPVLTSPGSAVLKLKSILTPAAVA